MDKIGIITIIDYLNYGNRLQNYAVQETYENMGFRAETIYNEIGSYVAPGLSNSFRDRFNRLISKYKLSELPDVFFKKLTERKKYQNTDLNEQNKKLIEIKETRLIEFTNRYINQSKYKIISNSIPDEIEEAYAFFSTGSDQIWNPVYRAAYPVDFLTFTINAKKIAFSPSIGIDILPKYVSDIYKNYLEKFDFISVREHSGANILQELLGRDVPVTLDPTLMLASDDWRKISYRPNIFPSRKYLLTYFLGTNTDNAQIVNAIDFYKENYDLEIVNLADFNMPSYYCIDPSEFLYLIDNSELILTDSFHGCVFSILFEKPFIVFNRGNISSRIDTLLSSLCLENNRASYLKNNLEEVFETNYIESKDRLEDLKKDTLNFLYDATHR